MIKSLSIWALAFVLAFSVGCTKLQKNKSKTAGTAKQAKTQSEITQQEVDRLVEAKAKVDPYLRSQTDVGLEASATSGGSVQVTITNKTSGVLDVGPKCFGVIRPGTKEVAEAEPQSEKLFPKARVAGGEQASGELKFPPGTSLRGSRLVFRHPNCEPAMAEIK